jgi:hypothetical protein
MWGLMIVSYLCTAISIVLLAFTGLQGYFQFHLMQANHPQFALFTAIFYMFTETLVMFYFIGSGTAIKKSIKMRAGETSLYEKVKKTKMILFPHLTMNMLFIGTVFILGGAVQTGSVPGWMHGLLFDLAFIHFLYVIVIQHRGFKENVEIIGEIAIIDSTAANKSPA